MKLKKKIKKFFLLFFVFLIISVSVLGFSVSASSVSSNTRVFNVPIAKPNVSDNYAYIEIMYGDSSSTYCEVVLLNWVCLTLDDVEIFDSYQLCLDFTSSRNLSFYPISFNSLNTYTVSAYTTNTAGSDYFLNSSGAPLSFGYSSPQYVKGIKVYGNIKVTTNDMINNEDNFIVNYGSEAASYIMLGNILNQLVNGANSQTQQIINNQDKNTDKVTNGWQQENEIDTSTTDEYASQDAALQGATEQGRSQAVGVFESFGSLFQGGGHLSKGLLSVSAIFTQFMQIDWLNSLLQFSLALGVFAFVIGTGSAVFKSAHEKFDSRKSKNSSDSSERG